MHLTGKTKGFFRRSIVIDRDGTWQGSLVVRGMVSELTMADGTVHSFAVVEGQPFSLRWEQGGREIAVIDPLTEENLATGILYRGARYTLVREESLSFSLLQDGRKLGEIRRQGLFKSGFSIETGRDIPVEAAVFMAYLTMVYPMLRFLPGGMPA